MIEEADERDDREQLERLRAIETMVLACGPSRSARRQTQLRYALALNTLAQGGAEAIPEGDPPLAALLRLYLSLAGRSSDDPAALDLLRLVRAIGPDLGGEPSAERLHAYLLRELDRRARVLERSLQPDDPAS